MNQDEFQDHVIDVLARLDTKVTDLVGNGQPGRVTKLEDKVDDLRKHRWWIAGAITGVSTSIGVVMNYLLK